MAGKTGTAGAERKGAYRGPQVLLVTKRKARKGRNPRTGAAMSIAATTVPRFRPGKTLKAAVK